MSRPLLGSVLLTVVELVASLKVDSIFELPIFMPIMLEIFSQNAINKIPDLGFTSIVKALLKIVKVLRHFLSPYLNSLIATLYIASVNFKENTKLVKNFTHIRQKLSNDVAYGVLIPAITGLVRTTL